MFKSALSPGASAGAKEPPLKGDLLTNSLLYRHFWAQREEIMKHKWYESERAGHDIGFDQALTDWAIKHRSEWRKRWQGKTQRSSIPGPGQVH